MDSNELRRLAAEVNEEHCESMRVVEAVLGRRRFLGRAAAVVGGGALAVPVLAGVASAQVTTTTPTTAAGPTTSTVPATTTTAPPRQPDAADKVFLGFLQSVELVFVNCYDIALASGKLDVDTTAVMAAFQSHHRQHAQSAAGLAAKGALGVANPGLLALYSTRFNAAGDQTAFVRLAFEMETAAAATFTLALATITGTDPAGVLAAVQPIEARQAAVYGQALGLDLTTYSPAFETTEAAITPTRYPIPEA